MSKLLSVILLIACSHCYGQFNRNYNATPDLLGSFNIEVISKDTFFILGANYDQNRNEFGFNSFLINGKGDSLKTSYFQDSSRSLYTGWCNSLNSTQDGGFIMGGSISDSLKLGYLVKFNSKGDTLWSRVISDTINQFIFRNAIQTRDGGYAAAGEFKGGPRSDGLLVKTDSLGKVEWEQHYSIFNNTHEFFSSVQQTTDGGFILGGHNLQYPNQNSRNLDPMLIRTDSTGKQLWRYEYDTPYNDQSANAIQTFDGNFVFSSGISISQGGSHTRGKPALFKVDAAGKLMWAKTYGPIRYNHYLFVVKQLPDSSLIAVGSGADGSTGTGYGVMVHTDKDGDSLFVNTYEHDPTESRNQNYLLDVIALDDGGFMAVGEVRDSPPATPKQDVWAIRVDSNGCIISNCLVGMNEVASAPPSDRIHIYPNPTTGLVKVQSPEYPLQVSVYDTQGQLQKEQNIYSSADHLHLNGVAGLYLLRIIDKEGKMLNRKLLKQ
jgi:hypothetical protein